MIAALTLLPALLTIAGRRVDRLRIPGLGGRSTADRRRRPLVPLEPRRSSAGRCSPRSSPAACCCCSASPPSRCGSAPTTPAPTRRARRPARPTTCSPKASAPASTAPSSMVAALPSKGDDAGPGRPAARRSKAKPGVAAVTPVDAQPGGRHRRLPGLPDHLAAERGDDRRCSTTSASDVIPPIEAQTGAQLHVGGITAIFEDFGNAISEKLPLFIGVVVLLSALLLMVVFRSMLVPLKAMVMNLLSIGAAFGLVVAVFQWGWGGEPDRRRRHRPDHLLLPGLPLRDRLRPLDGLRGLPDVAHPRGVGGTPRRAPTRSPAASP